MRCSFFFIIWYTLNSLSVLLKLSHKRIFKITFNLTVFVMTTICYNGPYVGYNITLIFKWVFVLKHIYIHIFIYLFVLL